MSRVQFNTLNNSLARCPHCRKVSSVGREFARTRAICHGLIGILVLAAAVGLTLATRSIVAQKPGIYAAWGGLPLSYQPCEWVSGGAGLGTCSGLRDRDALHVPVHLLRCHEGEQNRGAPLSLSPPPFPKSPYLCSTSRS